MCEVLLCMSVCGVHVTVCRGVWVCVCGSLRGTVCVHTRMSVRCVHGVCVCTNMGLCCRP